MATITYRTDGPWGSGKGSALTAGEVDANFDALNEELAGVIDSFPTPVGIADFTVDDATGTFMVYLTDGSEFGPLPLPRIMMQWQGEYAPGATYNTNDLITVQSDGVYLVLQNHEAASEFSASEVNTEGPLYVQVFGVPTATAIPVATSSIDSGTEDLAASHLGTYRRFTGTGVMLYRLQPDSSYDPPLPDGATVTIRLSGTGTLAWLAGAGVTVDAPDTLNLRKQGSTSTAVRVAANTWEVSGDLELEAVSA